MEQVRCIGVGLLLALAWWPLGVAAQGEPQLDAANAFVTRWKRSEYGYTNVWVPLYGKYAYSWEKADGTVVEQGVVDVAEGKMLELPADADGEYVLKAGPEGVRRIEFGRKNKNGSYYLVSSEPPRLLLSVEQWGSVAWESMAGAFMQCERMNIAAGAGKPDLSRVKSMESMFRCCSQFNAPIGDWDVSVVENMEDMFASCDAFNQPLGEWNVSRVKNMEDMFARCGAFNQPLGAWNVSGVENMNGMFAWCQAFNQPLENWDVSKVTDMGWMFTGCTSFNQPLGEWTLRSLRSSGEVDSHELGLAYSGLSLESYSSTLKAWATKRDQLPRGIRVQATLYYNAEGGTARQQLIDGNGWHFEGDAPLRAVEPLDASKAFVTRWQGEAGKTVQVPLVGQYAYEWAKSDGTVIQRGEVRLTAGHSLDLPTNGNGEYVLRAGPAGIQRIDMLFSETTEGLLLIERWGGVAWESMNAAFWGCKRMNIAEGAGKPDLHGVESLRAMFYKCEAFNSPVEDWDVSKVTDMSSMFSGCSSFNQPLEKWDVSKVEYMDAMFRGCSSFNQQLGGWTLSGLEEKSELDLSRSGMSVENYSSTLAAWEAKRDQLDKGVYILAIGLYYNAAGKAARQRLIDGKGWEFRGDSEVTVKDPQVSILAAPLSMVIGSTHAFTARVDPEEAPQGVVWSVAEGEGASFAGNVLSVSQLGMIIVRVETVAEPKRSATARIAVVEPIAVTGITLSPTEATVDVDAYLNLTASVVPEDATNQKVRWASSDEKVAQVDGTGRVKGIKAGKATITAVSDDGGHKATCTVTVRVALQGIKFSPSEISLVEGATEQLTVEYTPADASNRKVSYASDNESVATVDVAGKVTGVKVGTATITATSDDGGHKAICKVTVEAPIQLTAIKLLPAALSLAEGTTEQLTVEYTPADASNRKVSYSSDNESVATVDAAGKVKGIKAGAATITAVSEDGGHKATCAVTVTEGSTAVESALLAGVSVEPNPFGTNLCVQHAVSVMRYELVNALGAVVLRGVHDGGFFFSLQTEQLLPGMYWLRIVGRDGERVLSVVKK